MHSVAVNIVARAFGKHSISLSSIQGDRRFLCLDLILREAKLQPRLGS